MNRVTEVSVGLSVPTPTTREEKMTIINKISDRLLKPYPDKVLAIGVNGSIGQEIDGPYSDIEMHVVTRDELILKDRTIQN